MNTNNTYKTFDIAIIGGGLAGLSLSILCARAGFNTILYEKEKYPFHKVCGEYISFESWDFLRRLGLDLSSLKLPEIKKLMVSSPAGKHLKTALEPGGFGISRYLLDLSLKEISAATGVFVKEGVKADEVTFTKGVFNVTSGKESIQAKVVAGTFGKRSNLDVKWKRPFTLKRPGKLNNYLGIKYHIKGPFPRDTIALHNFKNGYCGLSAIEKDLYCLCYLTNAGNLKTAGNNIRKMERSVLQKNPFLKEIFSLADFEFKDPVTISQISFDKKNTVENHILYLGDAAGMIAPLCGNGMSMAMHGAKIAFNEIQLFLKGHQSRKQMEDKYITVWNRTFSKRMQNGRRIQKYFGNEILTDLFISFIKYFPGGIKKLIRSTHGNPF